MPHIEKRVSKNGDVSYRAAIEIAGYPRMKKSFARVKDAEIWAMQTELAMKNGTFKNLALLKKRILGEMIDKYIETTLVTKTDRERYRKQQKMQLLWWKKEIGGFELPNVTSEIISEKRDLLIKKGRKTRKGSTVNRYLAALSHVFTKGYKEWKWINENPMALVEKLKEPRGRVRCLSDIEREKLLPACKLISGVSKKPLEEITILAIATGARKDEILQLRREDLDLKRGLVTVHDTKNGERRSLHLSEGAIKLLKSYMKSIPGNSGLLFPGLRGAKLNIDNEFREAVKLAGLKDFRFHDCRHTFASYLAMNGATLAEIAEALGHKTLSMVKRYAHLCSTHTHKVVESMNERIFAQEGAI